jgi:hypothetical protein
VRAVFVRSVVVSRVSDLLAATGCSDLEELKSVVDSNCESDVWVADVGDGVEVGSGTSGIVLEFLFAVTDFWSTVDEVEQDGIRRIEGGELG